VALCAGSGGSVLKGVKADMYLTGMYVNQKKNPYHELLFLYCSLVNVLSSVCVSTKSGVILKMWLKNVGDTLKKIF